MPAMTLRARSSRWHLFARRPRPKSELYGSNGSCELLKTHGCTGRGHGNKGCAAGHTGPHLRLHPHNLLLLFLEQALIGLQILPENGLLPCLGGLHSLQAVRRIDLQLLQLLFHSLLLFLASLLHQCNRFVPSTFSNDAQKINKRPTLGESVNKTVSTASDGIRSKTGTPFYVLPRLVAHMHVQSDSGTSALARITN